MLKVEPLRANRAQYGLKIDIEDATNRLDWQSNDIKVSRKSSAYGDGTKNPLWVGSIVSWDGCPGSDVRSMRWTKRMMRKWPWEVMSIRLRQPAFPSLEHSSLSVCLTWLNATPLTLLEESDSDSFLCHSGTHWQRFIQLRFPCPQTQIKTFKALCLIKYVFS